MGCISPVSPEEDIQEEVVVKRAALARALRGCRPPGQGADMHDVMRPGAAEGPRESAAGWFAVGVLTALYACSFIDRQVMGLLVGPIRHDLGISDTQMSLLLGPAFAVFFALVSLPMGRLVDRVRRTRFIAAGVALWSLMTAGSGLAASYGQLFALRMGVGIGEATLSPAAYSLAADHFPKRRLGLALAVYGLGVPVGSGLAYVIGGVVVKAAMASPDLSLPLVGPLQPWQAVFLVVGLPGLLLALLTLTVREPPRSGARAEAASAAGQGLIAQLRRHPRAYACHILGFSTNALFGFGAAAWMPTLFIRLHHVEVQTVGIIFGTGLVVFGISGTLFWGTLHDRIARRGRTDAALLVGMTIALLAPLFAVTAALAPRLPVATAALFAFSFVGGAWSGPAAAALQVITPNRLRGQVSALYLFGINVLGLGLGPPAVALVSDGLFQRDSALGWSIAVVGAATATVATLLFLAGRAPYRRAAAEAS
jgi:MFS family permease